MYLAPKTLLKALASALVVVAAAANAPAAPILTEGQRSVETQFVLYAFESVFHDTWPSAAAVGDADAIRRFVAQRERVIHDLCDRVRDTGLGEEHKKELVEQLDIYMQFVRERGERVAKDLDKCAEPLIAKRDALLAKVFQDEAEKKARAAVGLVEIAARDFDPSTDPLAESIGLLFIAAARDAEIHQETMVTLLNAQEEWIKYYQNEGKAEYDKKADPIKRELVADRANELGSRQDDATALARTIATDYHWEASQTPFVAGDGEGERKRDPFTLVRRTNAEPVDASGGEREAAVRLDRAAKYMRAGDLAPGGDRSRAYDYFRLLCYDQAGLEANRAAALTAGPDGFYGGKAGKAGKLALEVWDKYQKAAKDQDLSGDPFYQYALALAYNGKAAKAYHALKANAKLFTASPTFYYDQARICVAAAERFPKLPTLEQLQLVSELPRQPFLFFRPQPSSAPALLLQEASLALDQAVYLGFNDFERAKKIRDLKLLREADAQTLGQRRTFEQIVGGP